MNHWIASTTLALLALIPLTTLQAGGLWLTDLEAAKDLAQEEEKDLIVLFTGSEWCGKCIKFEQDVLARPDFAAAAELFVLVKLEYPASEDELAEAQRQAGRHDKARQADRRADEILGNQDDQAK